jgi:hypothetical protein
VRWGDRAGRRLLRPGLGRGGGAPARCPVGPAGVQRRAGRGRGGGAPARCPVGPAGVQRRAGRGPQHRAGPGPDPAGGLRRLRRRSVRGWLEPLLPSLLDERIAVVGPRVIGSGGPGLLARYETRSGPLDLGAVAGPVRPGARVGHLPAAVPVCRTACLADGFDDRLRVAEDVDLRWRIAEQELGVRYGAARDRRSPHPGDVVGLAEAAVQLRPLGCGTGHTPPRDCRPGGREPVDRTGGCRPHPSPPRAGGGLHSTGRGGPAQATAGRCREGPGVRATGWCRAGVDAGRPGRGADVATGARATALVSRRVRRLTAAAVAVRLVRGWRAERADLDLLHWVRPAGDRGPHLRHRRVACRRRTPRPAVVLPRNN